MSELEVKLRNWLKYSVLLTCTPFLFALILWGIIGYPKDWLEQFPDLILTVFSVGVNAVSYISELEGQADSPKRIVYIKDLCEIGLFFFLVLYFGIFNFDFTQNLLFKNKENANQALYIVYWGTWGVGMLYALSIVVIEVWQEKRKNRGKSK